MFPWFGKASQNRRLSSYFLATSGVAALTAILPFGMGELLARVRATLRRSPEVSEETTVIEEGDFRFDLERREVLVAGREIRLSPKEFDLLVFFVRHSGKVLTHRTLLPNTWGGNYTDQTEYLRVFIRHLRKKIEPDPAKPRYILTDPWVGYRFLSGSKSGRVA